MIKTAQDAYLAGRQAAMEKLAEPKNPAEPGMLDKIKSMASTAGGNQMDVLRNLGLTGRDLTTGKHELYDPRAYATMENLARAGMLAGAGGGAYLGGMDPRAAALASAGALGGGLVGGNLGQGVDAALSELGYGAPGRDMATSIGGALGGLGGGLAAGKYL